MDGLVKLKPCPFCGGAADIAICDGEGNRRDNEYLKNPYSGVTYGIVHKHERNAHCPIATYSVDGGMLGVYLYESLEELESKWNERYSEGAE